MKQSRKGINNPNYKTGLCELNKKRPSYYNTWCNMKSRCYNKNNPKYHRYGARGIKVCDEWLDIEGFMNWVSISGWKEGLTLDRIDNDKDYCPENCHWVTVQINSKKKSTTKINDDIAKQIRNEENKNLTYLAKKYNCTEGNIWFILNNVTHV